MDFYTHFNDAQRLADSIDDWEVDSFSWQKAYIAAVFAAIAYEEVPQFELKKTKRAKLIPCDRYQAHVARWETEQRRASILDLDTNTQTEVIVRGRVVITISRLRRDSFLSLRGTALSFSDFKADLDIRKVRYQSGFGESARLHRGFFDAVLECFDEVVERLRAMNNDPHVPVCVTGHSLGGAMPQSFTPGWTKPTFIPSAIEGGIEFRHRPLATPLACLDTETRARSRFCRNPSTPSTNWTLYQRFRPNCSASPTRPTNDA